MKMPIYFTSISNIEISKFMKAKHFQYFIISIVVLSFLTT